MVFDKLKKLTGDKPLVPAAPAAPAGQAPDKKTIYRNRYNFGVNFGSQFVLEKFIFDKFFVDNTGTELEAITAYIKQNGADNTQKDLEAHWSGFATDDDWNWLKSKGVKAVRLPIGYWHVNGGSFASGTPFASIAGVYKNAWNHIKDVVNKAKDNEIGVLVDLHAVPGGANTGDHSGQKLDKPEFWSNKNYQQIAIQALEFIANEFKDQENVVGLQIVNEIDFDNNPSNQQEYYRKATKHIRQIDGNIPIIISDGWWPDQYVKWINENEQNLNNQSVGLVIDDHVYRCFSDADKAKSPEQIIKDLDGDVLTNLSGPADIIVGEYSLVLDGESWNKTSGDRAQLVHQYGNELSRIFAERASTGTYFWTLKFEHGDGGEWGFYPSVNSGAIPAHPTGLSKVPTEDEFNSILNNELNQHSSYWDGQNPNEKYEHWRYQEGFTSAWVDSQSFGQFNGSKIGRLSAWKSARRAEHIQNRGNSNFIWEWEQGFDKAISIFSQVAFQ
ncbi:Glucan 1,3-beta-glucosidase 3 [Wickerhamomyces ciferrii]|uniref:Glucan 1,3-beta-glucosidase 3 n=1 Tax=Wickerhamomyces ciferrii (strain ATCC 14091 / BCRC 22168 / CBS 111 / JCM 3599 / NBRC 0793 / NRRL Y-1031 F-60-10) TaxID=1206466 RepID=K0KVJ2_WICCF|nr:Glucan 1,3-beta-glucosidase 3 [Wickerhamomyces ciferrii]CCH45484.1 Glucan 1,3-beta-glucosidase 3 [Wickerhamomyces ciferrii]